MVSDLESRLNPTMVLALPQGEELKALARLSDTPDFVTFCSYLDKCLLEQDKKNRVAKDETSLRQGQGIGQALESVLNHAVSAKDNVRRTA